MDAGDKTAMTDRIRALLSPNRPWLHLIYLGFFGFGWLYRSPGQQEVLLALAAMAGFLGLYVFSLRRRDWTVYPAALGTALLGFAFMPVNIGGAVYLVFAAAMLGWLPHSRLRTASFALLALATLGASWLTQQPASYVIVLLILAAVAAGGATMGARRQRQDDDAQAAQRRASALAAEAERQRIARDLHDLLGHTLSLVTLKADLATRLFDNDPARARSELAQIQSISRDALAEVREAVAGLRDRSLPDAAAEACRHLEAAGLAVSLDLGALSPPRTQSTALAMVVREATTNILRHAQANRVTIQLMEAENGIELSVGDDGRGGASIGAAGLGGLATRIQALSGRLSVYDAPEHTGTMLTVWLPASGGDSHA